MLSTTCPWLSAEAAGTCQGRHSARLAKNATCRVVFVARHVLRGQAQTRVARRKGAAAACVLTGLGLDPEAQHVLRTLARLDVQLRANLRAE